MTLFYFVDLYELDSQSNQKKISTFKMDGDNSGGVEIEGDMRHPVVEGLQGEGIFDYKTSTPTKLYLNDGMSFLENLKYNFRSGYLSATDVKKQVLD